MQHLYCITSLHNSCLLIPTYGHQTAPTWTQSTTRCGSDAAASISDQSPHHRWTERTPDCSLVSVPTGHCQHCNQPVEKASSGMCPCKWRPFWTPSVKLQTLPNIFGVSCVFSSRFWCPIFTVLITATGLLGMVSPTKPECLAIEFLMYNATRMTRKWIRIYYRIWQHQY